MKNQITTNAGAATTAHFLALGRPIDSLDGTQRQQWQFKLDHKLLCMERANERADYYTANIFCTQADYYKRLLGILPPL